MRIFELHFNPKLKDDYLFDSFIFEPSNSFERKLGALYEAGELKNALPPNSKFLDKLAKAVKEKYYSISNKNSEKAISEALKTANEFLGQELRNDNVSWLGNLSFVALALKDSNLIFTKTGDIKVLMIRSGSVTDIGKSLEIEKIDPYPLKVFFNIVSGKLAEGDIILAATKEIYEYLIREKTLEKLARTGVLDEKNIKEIFPQDNPSEKEKPKFSGLCLAIYFTKNGKTAAGRKTKSVFSQGKKETSIPKILANYFAPFSLKNIISLLKEKAKKRNKKSTKLKVKIKGSEPVAFSGLKNLKFSKQNLLLIALMLGLLFFGFLFFKNKNKKNVSVNSSIDRIEQIAKDAQLALDSKDAEKAQQLFKEALGNISGLPRNNNVRIPGLKKSIEDSLTKLNNIEKIENPNVFYELKADGFSADKISYSNNHIFFFSKNSKDIYDLDLEQENFNLIEADRNFDFVVSDSNKIFAFSSPNIVSQYDNNSWQEKYLQSAANPKISQMVVYFQNVYLLNSSNCQIIKFGFANADSSNWLKENLKQNCSQTKSMAIDGSVWLLNKDNSIDVYRKGVFLKNIKINIFPEPENIVKIDTRAGSPYIYLLDAGQKKIIILDKNGSIFKQFASDKFDNLKDFSISGDGKTIYLLNANKIFSIEI